MTAPLQSTLSPLFAHGRPNVRPDEVALALGISVRQAQELEEAGWLQAIGIGDADERRNERLRFARSSVEGFYAFRLEQRGQPVLFDLSPEAARWRDHLRGRNANKAARNAALPPTNQKLQPA